MKRKEELFFVLLLVLVIFVSGCQSQDTPFIPSQVDNDDIHALDRDKDGLACETLP